MLPIYEAIAYENRIMLGGTTKPLLFLIHTGSAYELYVVKIFSKKDRKQYNPTSKECYAYALAEEFSLQQPHAAIIEFKKDLLASIPVDISQRIYESGSFFHFATKYGDGFTVMNTNLKESDLYNYEVETVFAFDILILNPDRRKVKPNLLINEKDYLLIDHELSLQINDRFLNCLSENDFSFLYNSQGLKDHIFLPNLKKLSKKVNLRFEHFEYHLRTLNLRKLEDVKDQLDEIHVDTNDFYLIKNYIAEIKSKATLFIKMLNNFL